MEDYGVEVNHPDFNPDSINVGAIVVSASDSETDTGEFRRSRTAELGESDSSESPPPQYIAELGREFPEFKDIASAYGLDVKQPSTCIPGVFGTAEVKDISHFKVTREAIADEWSTEETHSTTVDGVTDINGGDAPSTDRGTMDSDGDEGGVADESPVDMVDNSVDPGFKDEDTRDLEAYGDVIMATIVDKSVRELEPEILPDVQVAVSVSEQIGDPAPNPDNTEMDSTIVPESSTDDSDVPGDVSEQLDDTERAASSHDDDDHHHQTDSNNMDSEDTSEQQVAVVSMSETLENADEGLVTDQLPDEKDEEDVHDVSLEPPPLFSDTEISEADDELKDLEEPTESLLEPASEMDLVLEENAMTAVETVHDVVMGEGKRITDTELECFTDVIRNSPSITVELMPTSEAVPTFSTIGPSKTSLNEMLKGSAVALPYVTVESDSLSVDDDLPPRHGGGKSTNENDSITIAEECVMNRIALGKNRMHGPYLKYEDTIANRSKQPYVVFEDVGLEKTKEAIVEVAAIESAFTDEAFVEVAVIEPVDNHGKNLFAEDNDHPDRKTPGDDLDLDRYVTAPDYSMWSVNPKTGDHEFDPGPLAVDFYCNICQRSLPLGAFRIRCAECLDFDLCISCACKGPDRNNHSSDHKYIPISPNSFILFGDWTADEELLLLEGISKYGFGNWNQVADMVNRISSRNKSATECEQHYGEYYIRSHYSPFPDISRMRTPVQDHPAKEKLYNFFHHVRQSHQSDKPSDCIELNQQPFDESFHHVDIIPPVADIANGGSARVKFFQHFNGYNLYRDELDSEHNNDAEAIIKDLEFEPWDTPAEIEFKLRLVEIYNSLLDDRIQRKRLLIHRFWNDYPTRENGFLSMNQVEKSAYWRLTPLMRFHTEEDHLRLAKLVVAKIEIEKRLRVLNTWYSLGLRTVSDIESFDMEKIHTVEAFGSIEDIHPITRNLLDTGEITESDLNEMTEQLTKKFCSDFSISKSQIDTMLAEIGKLNEGSPFAVDDNATALPTWDICFQDDTMVSHNTVGVHPPPIDIDLSPYTECHMRLVLDEEGTDFECPTLDMNKLKFSSIPDSAVQQSQALSGYRSCLYIAKVSPQLKGRMRRGTFKRKRMPQFSDAMKRLHVRK